ncbi:MAG: DNA cytosine methyltransferase [Porphyromonas sp.]|nr:DNA cytosine methyltransferase [Porphyromonas sp.]
MTHASLFSGIGGFDLAAEQVGWTNLFHCEWDPFCRRVLNYHFPNSISYEDIRETDFREWKGKVDVLSGGFPCQPFSEAGLRKGAEDDRYLWPEMLRAIEEIRPTWIVGENVAGLLSMVFPGETTEVENYEDLFGEKHVLYEQRSPYILHGVISDLEERGYSVQSFLIPACAIGAPHRRDRIWIVAYAANSGTKNFEQGRKNDTSITPTSSDPRGNGRREWRAGGRRISQDKTQWLDLQQFTSRLGEESATTNSTSSSNQRQCDEQSEDRELHRCNSRGLQAEETRQHWRNFPTQSPVCGGDDGISREMDGITFPKWRKESIKAYGNAIVPELARIIFDGINEVEKVKEELLNFFETQEN